jgi:DNA-binding transcriptional LysR family regulator
MLLQPFLARYPEVSLTIVPQESPLLEEWLSAQRHDLGLTETLSTPAGTARTELISLDEVCVLPAGHRLAGKAVLTPEDFHGENYISLSQTDSYRQLLDTLFAEHQVVIRRFSVSVPFTVSLIRPLHRPASALVDAFTEHLTEHARQVALRLPDLQNPL